MVANEPIAPVAGEGHQSAGDTMKITYITDSKWFLKSGDTGVIRLDQDIEKLLNHAVAKLSENKTIKSIEQEVEFKGKKYKANVFRSDLKTRVKFIELHNKRTLRVVTQNDLDECDQGAFCYCLFILALIGCIGISLLHF